MNKLYWPIEKLKLNKNNPRICSDDDLNLLEDSLREDELFEPLLIKPNGLVLGGNHRLMVLQRMAKIEPLNPVAFPTGKAEVWVEIRDPKTKAEELRLIAKANATYARWDEDRLKRDIEAAGKAFNRAANRFQLGPIVTAKDLMKLEVGGSLPDEDPNQERCPECDRPLKKKK